MAAQSLHLSKIHWTVSCCLCLVAFDDAHTRTPQPRERQEFRCVCVARFRFGLSTTCPPARGRYPTPPLDLCMQVLPCITLESRAVLSTIDVHQSVSAFSGCRKTGGTDGGRRSKPIRQYNSHTRATVTNVELLFIRFLCRCRFRFRC